MIDQVSKATLPSFGEPKTLFDNIDLSDIKSVLPEQDVNRIESSIEDTFYVYPITQGVYSVESVSNGEVTDAYEVILDRRSTCTCEDHLFRCSPRNKKCKHIWRVKFLIELGCLPDADERPYKWLINEIYKDKQWLSENTDSDKYVTRLSEIEDHLLQQNLYDIDYRAVFNERGEIMVSAGSQTI